MLDEDRAFLADLASFAFKNRTMAIDALYIGGATAKESALRHRRWLEPALTQAELEAIEETGSYQAVMFAKIFAEYMGAIEDFGALCSAIQFRARSGILARYFSAGVGEVASFFDHAIAHPEYDLGQLLELPTLDSFEGVVPDDELAGVKANYSGLPPRIVQVASVYRHVSGTQTLSELPSNWREQIVVMLDVTAGSEPASTRGIGPHIFNKLKHRFMVIGDVDRYASLPNADKFRVVLLRRDPEGINKLREAARTVCLLTSEVGITAFFLGQAGAI